MPTKKVTMQDIAAACGLSRNTVSKVFNGRGAVPEGTRRLILDTAQSLGYRQLPAGQAAAPAASRHGIALFSNRAIPAHYHYGAAFSSAFADRLSREGYSLMMYEITPQELRDKRLPSHFILEGTAGILAMELFDPDYTRLLCGLGLPTIFSDTYARAEASAMAADVISMENTASVMAVTAQAVATGARTLGFVGDIEHCNSFYERWYAFLAVLERERLPLDKRMCILEKDSGLYADTGWLVEQLRRMPSQPDAFLCANDFLAIQLMTALKTMGLRIPQDILVAGFDGTPESAVVDPPLTTVQIHSAEMGYIAAGMLLDRIQKPDLPFRRTYVQTDPVWRGSLCPASAHL